MSSLQSCLVPVPGKPFILKITMGNTDNSIQRQVNLSPPPIQPMTPADCNGQFVSDNVTNVPSDVKTSKQSVDMSTSEPGKIEGNPCTFDCDVCHKSLSSKRNLLRHIEMHSRSSFQRYKNESSEVEFLPEIDPRDSCFVCYVCNKTLSSKRSMLRHLEMHAKLPSQSQLNELHQSEQPSDLHLCQENSKVSDCNMENVRFDKPSKLDDSDMQLYQKNTKDPNSSNDSSQIPDLSSESIDLNSVTGTFQEFDLSSILIGSGEPQPLCTDSIKDIESEVQSSRKSDDSNACLFKTSERELTCNLCNKILSTNHSFLRCHLETRIKKTFNNLQNSLYSEDSNAKQSKENVNESDLIHQTALSPKLEVSDMQYCIENSKGLDLNTHKSDLPGDLCIQQGSKNSKDSDTKIKSSQKCIDLASQQLGNKVKKSPCFVCYICKKSMASKRNLLYHLQLHFKDINLSSQLNLPSQNELVDLKKLNHTVNSQESFSGIIQTHEMDYIIKCNQEILKKKKISYECHVCKKKLSSRRNLIRHVELHSNESSCVCDVCKKIFKSKELLNKHLSIHKEEKPIVCPVCNKIFRKRRYFLIHERFHTGKNLFICNICNKRFITVSSLRRHLASHSFVKTFSCSQCPQDITSPEDWKHHYTFHTKQHCCHICGKRFRKKMSLEAHINIHNNHMPFTCNVCQKGFASKLYLQNHMRIHTQNRPFSCNICLKAFFKRRDVEIHKRIHTGEKPHYCEYCDMKFTTIQSLKLHLFSHTGKPHECEVCHKRFSLKSHLVRHSRVHSGERPYACDLCKSAFATRKTLFRHYRVHTGEKPFVCEICQKGFTQRSNLIVHQYVHTDEKPYACELCPKKYTTKQSLNFHMNTHKRDDP